MNLAMNAGGIAPGTPDTLDEMSENEVVDNHLKDLFHEVLKERNESTDLLHWVDGQTVDVTGISGQSMHQFAKRAEAVGKEVSYEKKIYIKLKNQ